MLTVDATVRRILADPDSPSDLLVSFFELAAYYRMGAALAATTPLLAAGDRVRFTHDLHCRIDSLSRID